jgi:radical SAM protein with 4Fe4S-binding SPASM domain
MKRKKGLMAEDLFRKIIDEASGIDGIDQVTLTGLGEPLQDPSIVERTAYARSKLPKADINLFTNGSRLDARLAARLKRAGLSRIFISLNAVSAERRRDVMGLDDWEKVIEGIKATAALSGNGFKLTVTAVAAQDIMEPADVDLFMKAWGPAKDGGLGRICLEGNWAGAVRHMRFAGRKACLRALGMIMILWNGDMVACCHDPEGALKFGNVAEQTIREIYASAEYVRFRELHFLDRRNEIPLCSDCTTI